MLKPSYGAVYGTPLDTILRNLDCDYHGHTDQSVLWNDRASSLRARQQGVFRADVTATNSSALHEAELQTLHYAFARVMPLSEITAWLQEFAQ